ncbi:ATP-binding protein [Roseicyclus marinus]|uniref:ATP-binding protein n=1 Tax=Roseicyclus marinus TaxID=2161673 RepID=UPI0024108254|nr:ATP-binding protein [Roseicyclus marinus]MDG3041855.1 ATP-binding protein [Roseicyclus marinus]
MAGAEEKQGWRCRSCCKLAILFGVALFAAAVSLYLAGRAEQRREIAYLQALAQSEAGRVDTQLGAYKAALMTIAQSEALVGGDDLPTLRAEAERVGELFGVWFMLAPAGQSFEPLMRSGSREALPVTEPASAHPELVATEQAALESGQPTVSDAFTSLLTGALIVTLATGVPAGDGVATDRVLYLSFDMAHLSGLLQVDALPPDHVAIIFDGSRRVIARSADIDRHQLAPVPAMLAEAVPEAETAVWVGANDETVGLRRVHAIHRLEAAPHWGLAVSAPHRSVLALGLGTIWPALSVLATILLLVTGDTIRTRTMMARRARDRAMTKAAETAKLNEALRAEQARRTKLIGIVGHELRTPLIAQLGALDLLERDMPAPERAELIERARRDAHDMLDLLEDLLDVARIGTGEARLQPVRVDPAALVRETARMLEPLARRNSNEITVEILNETGPVLADPGALRRILLNFGSNAAKFTRDGKIVLALRARPAGEERIEVILSVTDTGVGIAPEDQGKLFQDFGMLEATRALDPGGTGLGLAICRGLAEAMGGRVGVTSRPGFGSTFTAEIPLPRCAEPAPLGDGTDLAGLRVLLAEDQEIIRRVTAHRLEALGAEVVAVADGVMAVAEAQSRDFDLILLDLRLPGLDGAEAARRIRSGAGHEAGAVIVGVTADRNAAAEALVADGVMAACLTKPLDPRALARHLRAAAGAPEMVPGGVCVIDAAAVDWLSEAPCFARELFETLRKDTEVALGAIAAARAAGDLSAVAEIAHRASGLAKACGASALGAAMDQIDRAALAGDAAGVDEARARACRVAAETDKALEARRETAAS